MFQLSAIPNYGHQCPRGFQRLSTILYPNTFQWVGDVIYRKLPGADSVPGSMKLLAFLEPL